MNAAREAYKLNKNITFFLLIFLLDQYFEFVMCSVCGMYGVSSSSILHGVDGGACSLGAFTVLILFEVLFEFVDIVWAIPSLRALCAALTWSPLSEYEFSERAFQIKKEKISHLLFHQRAPFNFVLFLSFFHPFIGTFDLLIFDRNCVSIFFDFNKYGKKDVWKARKCEKEMG